MVVSYFIRTLFPASPRRSTEPHRHRRCHINKGPQCGPRARPTTTPESHIPSQRADDAHFNTSFDNATWRDSGSQRSVLAMPGAWPRSSRSSAWRRRRRQEKSLRDTLALNQQRIDDLVRKHEEAQRRLEQLLKEEEERSQNASRLAEEQARRQEEEVERIRREEAEREKEARRQEEEARNQRFAEMEARRRAQREAQRRKEREEARRRERVRQQREEAIRRELEEAERQEREEARRRELEEAVRRQQQEEKLRQERRTAFATYEAKWKLLQDLANAAGGVTNRGVWGVVDFPWPIFAGNARLDATSVTEFLLHPDRPEQARTKRNTLRRECLRWHSDKLIKIMPVIREEERKEVQKFANLIMILLNEEMSHL